MNPADRRLPGLIRSVGVLCLTILLVAGSAPNNPALATATPTIGAVSAALIDSADGALLWGKDPDRSLPPASATKILTAIVVLRTSQPDEEVVVSRRAEAVGERDPRVVELGLRARERLTVEELLFGLLLISANDAAVALAEHAGGSVEGFVTLMNSEARSLGATGSTFRNPHGLDDPGHLSTAGDLALMGRAAMRFPLFSRIVSTATYELDRGPVSETLRNRNPLLGSYPGAVGIKTGTTDKAGQVLVAAAARGGEERIAVVLGSEDRVSDVTRVLNHGFEDFERVQPVTSGNVWGYATLGDGTTRRIVATEDLHLLVASGARVEASYEIESGSIVVAPEDTVQVPALLDCLETPCRRAGHGRNLMVIFWEAIGAVLRGSGRSPG